MQCSSGDGSGLLSHSSKLEGLILLSKYRNGLHTAFRSPPQWVCDSSPWHYLARVVVATLSCLRTCHDICTVRTWHRGMFLRLHLHCCTRDDSIRIRGPSWARLCEWNIWRIYSGTVFLEFSPSWRISNIKHTTKYSIKLPWVLKGEGGHVITSLSLKE